MLTKNKVLQVIDKMPDQFSLDELMEEMILIEKIQKGIEQSDKDEVVSDDDLNSRLPEWLR